MLFLFLIVHGLLDPQSSKCYILRGKSDSVLKSPLSKQIEKIMISGSLFVSFWRRLVIVIHVFPRLNFECFLGLHFGQLLPNMCAKLRLAEVQIRSLVNSLSQGMILKVPSLTVAPF